MRPPEEAVAEPSATTLQAGVGGLDDSGQTEGRAGRRLQSTAAESTAPSTEVRGECMLTVRPGSERRPSWTMVHNGRNCRS